MNSTYSLQSGDTPVLVNVPHAGTFVPHHIRDKFSKSAAGLPDTDWFVDQLYDWVGELGAGLMVATHSRYVIDLNRPPDDAALYKSGGTSLVPETTFTGEAIYRNLAPLAPAEVEQRRQLYWQPYHDRLLLELSRIRERFGYAILLDVHSILSHVPALFSGQLPDLNLGTNKAQSAAAGLISASVNSLSSSKGFSFVLDGRFQGGHITRFYGQPEQGWHALQLEMSQCVYMQEDPPEYQQQLALKVQPILRSWLRSLLDWTPVDEH